MMRIWIEYHNGKRVMAQGDGMRINRVTGAYEVYKRGQRQPLATVRPTSVYDWGVVTSEPKE